MTRHLTTPTGALQAWVSVLIVVLAVGLLAGFTITFVTYEVRKICGLVSLLDDLSQARPVPADPDAVRYRVELHKYRKEVC